MDKQLSLAKARELVEAGAHGDAYRLLLQVLSLDPDDEEVLWAIVALYEKKGTPAPVARYRARIAELYASQGRDEDALKLLRQAVEHHQDAEAADTRGPQQLRCLGARATGCPEAARAA